jgi:NADH-quinone oxidoreductase subunit N
MINTFFSIPFNIEFILFFFSIFYLIFCCFFKFLNVSFIFRLYQFTQYCLFFLVLIGVYLLFFFYEIEIGLFFNNFLINDFLTISVKSVILFVSFLAFFQYTIFINKNKTNWISIIEFPFLFLGSILFLLILISAYDLFLMALSIIGMSICLYGLLATNSVFGRLSREACIKYFIMSALSSGLILGGIKEFYLSCGTLNFSLINNFLIFKITENIYFFESFSIKIGLILLFFGFLFKLSAAPSHFWAPEVYEGTPFALIMYIILPIKIAISVVFLKILKSVFAISMLNFYSNYFLINEIELLLLFVIFLSMFIGGINAIFEQKLKKFIAYSSINQIGFLLIGFLGFNVSLFGVQSFFYFIFVYSFNLCLFFFLLFWYSKNYINKNTFKKKIKYFHFDQIFQELNYISDLKNFFWISKYYKEPIQFSNFYIIWFCFILVLFSLAGIPPLAGFFGKFYILLYAFKLKYWFLVSFSILISIFSAYYYLRILKVTFFEKSHSVNFLLSFSGFNSFFNDISFLAGENFIKNLKLISIFSIFSFFMLNFWLLDNYFLNFSFKLSQNLVFLIF